MTSFNAINDVSILSLYFIVTNKRIVSVNIEFCFVQTVHIATILSLFFIVTN